MVVAFNVVIDALNAKLVETLKAKLVGTLNTKLIQCLHSITLNEKNQSKRINKNIRISNITRKRIKLTKTSST